MLLQQILKSQNSIATCPGIAGLQMGRSIVTNLHSIKYSKLPETIQLASSLSQDILGFLLNTSDRDVSCVTLLMAHGL